MVKPCGKCRVEITEKERFMSCDCCKIPVHLTEECAGLCASEIKAVVIQKRVLLFFCDDCRTSFKQVPLLVRKVQELQKEVKDLRDEVKQLKESKANIGVYGQLSPEEIVNEINERQKRASNVIIYNLKESVCESYEQKLADDKNTVVQIINNLADVDTNSIKVFRLGRPNPENVRPIKVLLNNSSDVLKILKNKINAPEGIRVMSDQTKLQQDFFKSVKNKLNEMEAQGITDKTIKFLSGIPTIVTKKEQKN